MPKHLVLPLLMIVLFLAVIVYFTYQLAVHYGPLAAGIFALIEMQLIGVMVAAGVQANSLEIMSTAFRQLLGHRPGADEKKGP